MALEASAPIGPGGAAAAVTGAIRNAANQTGTSFSYLLATAKIESGLDPNVTMKSSSAAGLFQFIDQTWLGTLKQAGPAFGYGDYANAISRNASGHYSVDDPDMRRQIMKLRNDPTANAMMAGALTQQNAATLARRIGRPPTESELYIAHFFGAGGAGKLIQLAQNDPQANAAQAFPLAAHANRPIFYDRQGNARSIAGVYSELVRRFKVAGDGLGATVAGAAMHPMPQTALAAPPAARKGPPAADVAAVTRVFAAASAAPPARTAAMRISPAVGAPVVVAPAAAAPNAAAPTAATFNSLFSDQDRRTALDPAVVALWSVPASPPQPADAQAVPQPTANPRVNDTTGSAAFDLFRDLRANARAPGGSS
jgi:hypothetical protein